MKFEKPSPILVNKIKREAKRYKKETGVAHHEALNVAAKAAGYMGFQHMMNLFKGVK